MALIPF